MSGWRDEDGRTAADRNQRRRVHERIALTDRIKNRPLSLVKPALGALFIAILVFALVGAYG